MSINFMVSTIHFLDVFLYILDNNAYHNEISSLLLHPLFEIFLDLKYKTVWTILCIQLIFQFALVSIFTTIGVQFAQFTNCRIQDENADFNQNICQNNTSFKFRSGIIGCQINETHSLINNDTYPVICYRNTLILHEDVNFLETVCKFENCDSFYTLFAIFLIFMGISLLKEICEIFSLGIRAYFSKLECFNEIFLVCLSSTFAFSCINDNDHIDISAVHAFERNHGGNMEYNSHHLALHLAAWMVFFAWINMILYLGRLQNIGIYIFMALNVLKTMLGVLLTFTPWFAAFTFGFYILLQPHEDFDSYTRIFVRTFPMMAGEFNFNDYFDFNVVNSFGGRNFSTQVMFVFFVIVMTLIVMNLLIALTVSKIDELRKKSKLLQVKRMIDDVISLTSLVRYNKIKCLRKFLDPMNAQKGILDRLEDYSKVYIFKAMYFVFLYAVLLLL